MNGSLNEMLWWHQRTLQDFLEVPVKDLQCLDHVEWKVIVSGVWWHLLPFECTISVEWLFYSLLQFPPWRTWKSIDYRNNFEYLVEHLLPVVVEDNVRILSQWSFLSPFNSRLWGRYFARSFWMSFHVWIQIKVNLNVKWSLSYKRNEPQKDSWLIRGQECIRVTFPRYQIPSVWMEKIQ